MDSLCILFVESGLLDNDVAACIAALTEGTHNQDHVECSWADIHVEANDDYDDRKKNKRGDGFLYFGLRVYIEVNPGVERQTLVDGVARILEHLWAQGSRAVAACDFEDELPRNGGFKDGKEFGRT
jgi:hypothetical protein